MDSQQPVLAARYHVGWPSLPSLPLKFAEGSLPLQIVNSQEEIHKRVRDALERNSLIEEGKSIEFGRRDTSAPTVLIRTPWHQGSKTIWKKAIEEMVTSVKKDFPATIHEKLHFEMIAPEAYMISHANNVNIPWEEVQTVTERHLAANEATKGHRNLLTLCRRGFSANRIESPDPLTVHITVFKESDELEWDGIIEAIELEFRERGWNELRVHMEHSEPWSLGLFG